MTYLIAYIATGLLLGIASIIHRKSSRSRGVRFFAILGFWPILVLVAPDFLIDRTEESNQPLQAGQDAIDALKTISESDIAALTVDERARLDRIKLAGPTALTLFADSTNFETVLNQFWDEEVPPEAHDAINRARWRLEHEFWVDGGIRFSLSEPDWFVGFSIEFVKSISKIDKNKRARLLEAIAKIAAAPTTPLGDTIKPLTGDLGGLWRYRVGDDRLVYRPNSQSKKIVLLAFGARGGVYE